MLNKIILTILLLMYSVVISVAQDNNIETKDSTIQFKDRIGVRTNAVNWFLMTPNIDVEYDIINNKYKKVSLSIGGRYNWNSNFSEPHRYVYNVAGAKAGLRWYFRTYKREDWETKWMNSVEGFYDKFQAKKYSIRSRKNPRRYRAYYIGPYLSYDKYTLKLSDEGYQGTAISLGISLGYDIPLYKYNDGAAIDFEFGASAGFIYTGYDKFAYDSDSRCYHHVSTKDNHLVPYPIITDVNVSLVYRMKSIREQIVEVDKSRMEMMHEAYKRRLNYKEHMTETKVTVNEKGDTIYNVVKKYIDNDSINTWNSEVSRKNSEIEAYNKTLDKIPEIDSTLYLRKLKPMYKYLEISDKMLSFGYKKTIPNMPIDSIEQLDNKQLNEIIKAYKEIGNGDGLESVEQRMLTEYNSLRDMYFGNGDSLKPINLLEYLVEIVPDINEYCIINHNKKYFGASVADSTDILSSIYSVLDSDPNSTAVLEKGVLDTIYLVNSQSYAFNGENQEIEANNDALKLQALPFMPQMKTSNATVSSDDKKVKKEKTKRRKKKDKKEETIMTDSIVDKVLPDSLQNNIEQVLPDSLQNNGENIAYNYYKILNSNLATLKQKMVEIPRTIN